MLPGPGSTWECGLTKEPEVDREGMVTGQSRDLRPEVSLEGAGESLGSLDILPRISPDWTTHFPCP